MSDVKSFVHTKHRNPNPEIFSVNKKFGNDNIWLNSKLSINTVVKVVFFIPDEHNKEKILSISQPQKVFTDQIVMIKATIKSLSVVKEVYISESSIDKKNLTVVDPTGSIRVVHWGDYCEKEVVNNNNNTYIFKLFTYRLNKFKNYINVLKYGTCSIEECNSFK